MNHGNGWVGVDLDGTLAQYDKWVGPEHIGEPVAIMLERVKKWIKAGVKVKIFTARASDIMSHKLIKDWCESHGLPRLEVTNVKDFSMIELWDDRAVQVEPNTGKRYGQSRIGLL